MVPQFDSFLLLRNIFSLFAALHFSPLLYLQGFQGIAGDRGADGPLGSPVRSCYHSVILAFGRQIFLKENEAARQGDVRDWKRTDPLKHVALETQLGLIVHLFCVKQMPRSPINRGLMGFFFYLKGATRETRTSRTTRAPRRQGESTNMELSCPPKHFVILYLSDMWFVYVVSQGLTGKPGVEGPQGLVGMYVSDSSAGQIKGMHLYFLFTA